MLNKILNVNVSPNSIGGTFVWEVVNCNCTDLCVDCTCIGFSNTTGTVTNELITTEITYPEFCFEIMVKITITVMVNDIACESSFFYNIISEEIGTELTWSCISNESGCQQIVSNNTIFGTEEDCLNCTSCICNNTLPCNNATFTAEYDCDNKLLTINSTNTNVWCTNPYPVVEMVELLVIVTQSSYLNQQIVNLPCNNLFPLILDLSVNPLPDGFYYTNIVIQLNGCEALVDTLEINCPGINGSTNLSCCTSGSSSDFQTNQQGNPPRVYTFDLGNTTADSIIVDFHTKNQADKLSIYSQWDNNTLIGNEIATSEYIGSCWSCCNHSYYPFRVGYYERYYDSNVPIDSPYTICNAGNLSNPLSGGIPVPPLLPQLSPPNDFTSFNGDDAEDGQCRLTLTKDYLDTITFTNNIMYIVVYSNDSVVYSNDSYEDPCSCSTLWGFKVLCDTLCDCPPITTPIVNVVSSDCLTEQGYIDIIQDCETINGYSSHLQYSLDGLIWVDEAPTYNILPALDTTNQSLYTRCVVDTNEFCFGDVYIDSYVKPECCPGIEYTLECNTNTAYPIYTYHINYVIPECDSTPNNSTVQNTGNGYVYTENYAGDSIILDVYFNNNSIYNIYVNCDLCFTSQYLLSSNQIQNEMNNFVCMSECPTLETTSNSPSCKGDTIELYSDITYGDHICTGAIYTWTGVNGFTSTLANPTIPNGQSINVGTYYLTVTFSEPACKNCILTDTVIVNGFPLPDIPIGYANVTICSGTSTTLTSINVQPCCNICTVNWYSALTGGTLLHTGVSYTTPVLNTTITYYVACESVNGGCESTPRTPIIVTVEPCCTTNMSANNISTCLDTNGGTLPVTYMFSTACTTSSVTADFTNGWIYNSSTNSITYPPNTTPGTYTVDLDWICDTCFGTTTINVILNKPIVTAVPINNTCPTTSVSLYSAISVTPTVGINSGNTIFKTGAVCGSNGILTGGTTITDSPVANITNWSSIGATTIWYQYTDSVTNCKSCGSFVATVNACCNTTMTVNDVVTCLSPTGGTVNLVANYTPACPTGDIVSVTLPTPSWTFNPANNSITYPANVAPNTYTLSATLNCGACTMIDTFTFTINTASVTMQDIANDCSNLLNSTTVDLNDAIVTSDPLYTIVYRQYNILTNSTPVCSSTGTLTGGILISNPTSWTVPIGTTTIWYQYTNTATGCKKCGSFIVTGTTCCTVSAGDNTTQTTCI